MKVKAIKNYFDLDLKRFVEADEILEVTDERGTELSSSDNQAGRPLVEILEVPKKTNKKTTKEA